MDNVRLEGQEGNTAKEAKPVETENAESKTIKYVEYETTENAEIEAIENAENVTAEKVEIETSENVENETDTKNGETAVKIDLNGPAPLGIADWIWEKITGGGVDSANHTAKTRLTRNGSDGTVGRSGADETRSDTGRKSGRF